MPTTASEKRLPLPNDPTTARVSVTWDPAASTRGAGGVWRRVASRLRSNWWAPVDAVVAALSMLLAHRLSPVFAGDPLGPEPFRAALIHGGAFMLVAYTVGLYDWDVLARSRTTLVLRALLSAAVSAVVTLAFFQLAFYRPIGRWVLLGTIALSAPLVTVPHLVNWSLLRRRPRRVLFVGDGALTERLTSGLLAAERALYEVAGRWPADARTAEDRDLGAFCRGRGVDEIVLPSALTDVQATLVPALRCLPLGCRVRSEADFHEDVFRAVPVAAVTPEWMLSRGWDASDHMAEAMKRLSDAVLALVLLVLSLPLQLLVALAIRLQGDGPVLYVQTRAGRYGRPFRMLKFRTMRTDAEDGTARWAQDDDPRRTAVGRVLRRTRLDELPQLVNVLLGDMSFVGPRPERPEFVGELERAIPYYAWRHVVRPGLTGWAQITYGYGASVDDARRKLEYDLYYIRHYSLGTDLFIVLRTLSAALRGAR
jgi:exopolysaccharide biosynthesis polyprenyl glycosylphosphotransferase